MLDQVCYCCSGKMFEVCCKPFIDGVRLPETAEQLMRSRYTAYATSAVEYIIQTTHISTRNAYNAKAIREWAETSQWIKLEVLKTVKGTAADLNGKVEFKAYFKDLSNVENIHYEYSHFMKEKGIWFFVEGKVF